MRIQANGIAIEVDDQGPATGEPILLIMGLGMQLLGWPDELVADLVSRGYRVIRFDNRDIGLSQGFDHMGVPNLVRSSLRYMLRLRVHSPYPLRAMADDALGVLDALGLDWAHVVGASMGGMIAQHLAATYRRRVRSLALIMTSSGARHLPQARAPVRRALISRPGTADPTIVIRHLEQVLRLIGSPAYPPDPQRQRRRLEAMVRRAWRPSGTARQLVAVVADGDRSPLLRRIEAPTFVIHGQEDPLVPVAAAHDLAAKIRGAKLDIVPGMGHDLPLELLPRIAADIAEIAGAASRAAASPAPLP